MIFRWFFFLRYSWNRTGILVNQRRRSFKRRQTDDFFPKPNPKSLQKIIYSKLRNKIQTKEEKNGQKKRAKSRIHQEKWTGDENLTPSFKSSSWCSKLHIFHIRKDSFSWSQFVRVMTQSLSLVLLSIW